MDVDVAVDRVGDELRYLTFIDAVGLRVIGWNLEPLPAIDEGSAHRLPGIVRIMRDARDQAHEPESSPAR